MGPRQCAPQLWRTVCAGERSGQDFKGRLQAVWLTDHGHVPGRRRAGPNRYRLVLRLRSDARAGDGFPPLDGGLRPRAMGRHRCDEGSGVRGCNPPQNYGQ